MRTTKRVFMQSDRQLLSLLSGLPETNRIELRSFLAFSERLDGRSAGDAVDDLLVSLALFHTTTGRAN